MAEVDLQTLFPNMKPVRSGPPLYTLNGCGVNMYGRRDFDAQTHTYIKTWCFCMLFVPVIPLRSTGWQMARKVAGISWAGSLSPPLAKALRMAMVLGVLLVSVAIGWNAYSSTDEYIDGQTLAQADALVASGQLGDAAAKYRVVASGMTSHRDEGLAGLVGMFGPPVQTAPASEVAKAATIVIHLSQRRGKPIVPVLHQRLAALAEARQSADPKGALELLNVALDAGADFEALRPKRQALLESLLAKEPGQLMWLTELAVIHAQHDDFDKAKALLVPHAAKLADTDGARILGQIYAHEGNIDGAYALLKPYAKGRLERLHSATNQLDNAYQRAWDEQIELLRNNKAPQSFYDNYDRAPDEARKQTLVNEYISPRIKDLPAIVAAREKVMEESDVVPVALDLGIVMLQRSQTLTDPAKRKAELEEAEKVFLSIRGMAGDTDAYRLSLAQVNYWLGKHDQGKALFEEFLTSKKRSDESLMTVARVLREVGSHQEGRTLAEEAYKKAADASKRFLAADLRAASPLDTDDLILWLRRCNPDDPQVTAHLHEAQGTKALEDNRFDEAARELRAAVSTYASLPENATTLNNGALAQQGLFAITGDIEDFRGAVRMLERAVALAPSDGILLSNTAHSLMILATADVAQAGLDFKILRSGLGLGALNFLYADLPGRQALEQRIRQHQDFKKGLTLLDKVFLVSPKDASAYRSATEFYRFVQDEPALRALLARVKGVELDYSAEIAEQKKYIQGERDAAMLRQSSAQIQRWEAVVAQTRARKDATFAYAADALASSWQASGSLGGRVDVDAMVRLAEDADAAAPSRGSHWNIITTLGYRADAALTSSLPAYAQHVRETKRHLSAFERLVLAIQRDGPMRTAVRANADFKRISALLVDSGNKYPRGWTAREWALFNVTDTTQAKQVADVLRARPIELLEAALDAELRPSLLPYAMELAWMHEMDGRRDEANAVFKRLKSFGLPMPNLP